MAITKYTADIVLDASCDYVKNNVTEMYVCSGANSPATRAAAISAALATKTEQPAITLEVQDNVHELFSDNVKLFIIKSNGTIQLSYKKILRKKKKFTYKVAV